MPYALEGLWALLNDRTIQWSDQAFDKKKAYVMSLFSALAYEHIPEFEIEYNRRAQVIPCFAYQEHLKGRLTIDIEILRGRFDFAQVEIVETEYAVYIIIKVSNLIVISVRGTVPTYYYDLRADLDIRKVHFSDGNKKGFFHKGFFDEMVATEPKLRDVLRKFGAFDNQHNAPNVYVTGHSLGGAIAAILQGLWILSPHPTLGLPFSITLSDRFICHSTYTFGMPKFADAEIVRVFRRIYHIRNGYDPVPMLPPGFAHDQTQETKLAPYDTAGVDPIKAFAIALWVYSLGRFRMIKNHGIETYWEKLAEEIGVEVPDRVLPPDPNLLRRIPG